MNWFKFLFIVLTFFSQIPYPFSIIFEALEGRFHTFALNVSFHFRQKIFGPSVCFFTIFPRT